MTTPMGETIAVLPDLAVILAHRRATSHCGEEFRAECRHQVGTLTTSWSPVSPSLAPVFSAIKRLADASQS